MSKQGFHLEQTPDPDPPLTPPSRRKVNSAAAWLLIFLALAGVALAWHYRFGRSEDSKIRVPGVTHTVAYSVTGTAGTAKITYSDGAGKTKTLDTVALPWTETFDANSGVFLDLNATSLSPTGSLTADITVDGASRKKSSANNAYGETEVSDSL